MILATDFFTPYYFLAVGFGLFAVIISVIGMKKPQDFPGKFYGPMILVGVIFAIATFTFVWRGGEKEVDHRNAEQKEKTEQLEHAEETTGQVAPLPAGVKPTA